MRLGLDLDLVDIECDEDRMAERSAAGSSWADPSACGKDESSNESVVAAVVGGVRPATDWPGNVVVTADEAGRVRVEGLSLRVGVDVRREADIEASPLLTCLRPGTTLGEGDPFVR